MLQMTTKSFPTSESEQLGDSFKLLPINTPKWVPLSVLERDRPLLLLLRLATRNDALQWTQNFKVVLTKLCGTVGLQYPKFLVYHARGFIHQPH